MWDTTNLNCNLPMGRKTVGWSAVDPMFAKKERDMGPPGLSQGRFYKSFSKKLLQGFRHGNVFPDTLISHIINVLCLLSPIPHRPGSSAPFAGCGGFSAMPAVKPGYAGSPIAFSSNARAFFLRRVLRQDRAALDRLSSRLTAPWAKDDSHVPPSRERTCQF